jgi:hypothetical protein
MAKAKPTKIHYGNNGYLKTTPARVKKWALCVAQPNLDAAFRQALSDADQASDQLRNRLNEFRLGSSMDIDKVRLVTLTLKALDDRIRLMMDS